MALDTLRRHNEVNYLLYYPGPYMLQNYQHWAAENEDPQRDIEVENADRIGPNRHWWMQPLWQIAYPDNLIEDNSDDEASDQEEDTDVDNGNDEDDQQVLELQPQDRPA